jgi:hypothetical protein
MQILLNTRASSRDANAVEKGNDRQKKKPRTHSASVFQGSRPDSSQNTTTERSEASMETKGK